MPSKIFNTSSPLKPSKNLRFDNPMPHKVSGGSVPKSSKPKLPHAKLMHAEKPPVRRPKSSKPVRW